MAATSAAMTENNSRPSSPAKVIQYPRKQQVRSARWYLTVIAGLDPAIHRLLRR
jgi:hypothetical protein